MNNLDLLVPQQPVQRDTWHWATITQADPLRVRLDGDDVSLDVAPDYLYAPLQVGQRVWVQIKDRRVIVHGSAGGTVTAGGGIIEVVAGPGVTVDSTDPARPIVSAESEVFQFGSFTTVNAWSVNHATWTARVGWNAVDNEGGSDWFINGGANYSAGNITVMVAGLYVIDAAVMFNSNPTGLRAARITVGGVVLQQTERNAASANFATIEMRHTARIAAGQNVQIQGYQGSGAALTWYPDSSFNWLQIRRIG